MIRLGKVYENMMVDLQLTNKKLSERAKRIIMISTGVDYDRAEKYLSAAENNVKAALVMILAKTDLAGARARLRRTDGFVKDAIMPTDR